MNNEVIAQASARALWKWSVSKMRPVLSAILWFGFVFSSKLQFSHLAYLSKFHSKGYLKVISVMRMLHVCVSVPGINPLHALLGGSIFRRYFKTWRFNELNIYMLYRSDELSTICHVMSQYRWSIHEWDILSHIERLSLFFFISWESVFPSEAT